MRLTSGEVLLRWPLCTHILTAGWTYNDGSAHNAIDLRAGAGTPVYAAEGGTVDQLQTWDGHTRTGMQSYGTMVRLRHADYRGQPLQTRYVHLTRACVKAGQLVREGDLLGYSGQTGNCAGAHLHFEVLLAGVRCNPLNWLDGEFSCASPAVQAHLGVYEGVRRPGTPAPARLQRLSIGPVSDGDAMSFWNLAQRLGVPYTAAYVEEG